MGTVVKLVEVWMRGKRAMNWKSSEGDNVRCAVYNEYLSK
jgi:hypothetical protein